MLRRKRLNPCSFSLEFNDKLISTVQNIIEDIYSTYHVEQGHIAAELAFQLTRKLATLSRPRELYRGWDQRSRKISSTADEVMDETTLAALYSPFSPSDQTQVTDGYSQKQMINNEVHI